MSSRPISSSTFIAERTKSLVQVVMVALPLLLGALWTRSDLGTWLNFALGVVTAVAVYWVPKARYLKGIVAAIGFGLQVAVSAYTDGEFSPAEINAIVLSFTGALATTYFPNLVLPPGVYRSEKA